MWLSRKSSYTKPKQKRERLNDRFDVFEILFQWSLENLLGSTWFLLCLAINDQDKLFSVNSVMIIPHLT